MRYWRCRLGWLGLFFWPVFGHMLCFQGEQVCCERCPWTASLPDFFACGGF
jgi:hypothetical protein